MPDVAVKVDCCNWPCLSHASEGHRHIERRDVRVEGMKVSEVMHTPGVVFLRDEAVSVDCCTGGPKVMPAKDKASVGM